MLKSESEILREVLNKQSTESEKIFMDQKKLDKELRLMIVEIENVSKISFEFLKKQLFQQKGSYEKAKRLGEEAELFLESYESLNMNESEKTKKIKSK